LNAVEPAGNTSRTYSPLVAIHREVYRKVAFTKNFRYASRCE